MFIDQVPKIPGSLAHRRTDAYNKVQVTIAQGHVQDVHLTHRGPVDLRKWAIFNTILMSPKSWLSQEHLDAGCEHSMVPMDS